MLFSQPSKRDFFIAAGSHKVLHQNEIFSLASMERDVY